MEILQKKCRCDGREEGEGGMGFAPDPEMCFHPKMPL